ncbi:hypothetical protein, partial [Klebsiella pneumoniae]|uniref:hypothetical protein n=1 Tax=Klebsiella pneumoniae TaxID=573 RepID=UPI001CA36919
GGLGVGRGLLLTLNAIFFSAGLRGVWLCAVFTPMRCNLRFPNTATKMAISSDVALIIAPIAKFY